MKTSNDPKVRRVFAAETKLQILKEGRSTPMTVSQVCDRYGPAAQTYIKSARRCFINGNARPSVRRWPRCRANRAAGRSCGPAKKPCWPKSNDCAKSSPS